MKILGRQANARQIYSASQLLALAKLAHVHLKSQEYLQACAIIAEATAIEKSDPLLQRPGWLAVNTV